jgi:hypothetical protein
LDLCGSGYRLTLRITEAALWIPQHQKQIISLCKSEHKPERSTHDIVCRIQQEDKQEEEGGRREGGMEEQNL